MGSEDKNLAEEDSEKSRKKDDIEWMVVPVFDGWFDWVLVKREGAVVASNNVPYEDPENELGAQSIPAGRLHREVERLRSRLRRD